MRKNLVIGIIAAVFSLAAVSVAGAAGTKATDSIWVIPATSSTTALASTSQMKYGESFKAGYSSRARDPWAYAQCWANSTTIVGTPNQGTYAAGDVVWSGYRSLTGLTGDTFLLADPIQGLWLGGGATCKLSLVTFSSGRQNVLASVDFVVAG